MVNERKITFCCRFMEVALLIGLIFTPLLTQFVIWSPFEIELPFMGGEIQHECTILPDCYLNPMELFISSIPEDFFFSLMLWQFYNVFKNIRLGEIFNTKQIHRFYVSGWCFILISLYLMVKDLFIPYFKNPTEEIEYYFLLNNIIYLPMGIGLVMLSHVLKLAVETKKEYELVI